MASKHRMASEIFIMDRRTQASVQELWASRLNQPVFSSVLPLLFMKEKEGGVLAKLLSSSNDEVKLKKC